MTEFTLIITMLVTSAFFSGAEIAYVTANRLRMEVFLRKRVFGSSLANHFVTNLDKTLTATLVGNNIALIIYSLTMAAVLDAIGMKSTFYQSVIASIIILLFGEVIPKLFAREVSEYAVLVVSPMIWLCYYLFYPFIKISELASGLLARLFNAKVENIDVFFRKQDMEILLRESTSTDEQKQETEIISNALLLNDIRVKESMIPRTEIEALAKSLSMKDVYQRFAESGYSKMPVYDGEIDNIIGVVFAYDLFKKPKTLQSITREILFVPETKRSAELLKEFNKTGDTVAVVVDEFGGTAGLVTSEDLIEELVGDIQDEFDDEEDVCKALSDDTFLISGRLKIDAINEKLNLHLPKEDYETLGGFILAKIGKIPLQGETYLIDDYKVTIAKSSKVKIDIVKLQFKRPPKA
jgi:putative hemolysin